MTALTSDYEAFECFVVTRCPGKSPHQLNATFVYLREAFPYIKALVGTIHVLVKDHSALDGEGGLPVPMIGKCVSTMMDI